MERFGAKATKAKQAQSRLKQIERIEVEELEESSRRSPLFRFDARAPERQGRARGRRRCRKAYGDKQVLRDVSLIVRRGERVAVIGPNGLGKSTLLKIVTGHLEADAGDASSWGTRCASATSRRTTTRCCTDAKTTPLDYVWERLSRRGDRATCAASSGACSSPATTSKKPIGALSGGEAARLIFCRIIVEQPNVLVLDEPTNHLDLEAIHALAEGLRGLRGHAAVRLARSLVRLASWRRASSS